MIIDFYALSTLTLEDWAIALSFVIVATGAAIFWDRYEARKEARRSSAAGTEVKTAGRLAWLKLWTTKLTHWIPGRSSK
ncbi:MAG: hypothetical protein HQK54_09740 [Oligoflexales bacterium]|nr:hypothetical protein [Oligoflexales bacterium]